jgi:hypothetical protein
MEIVGYLLVGGCYALAIFLLARCVGFNERRE